VRSDCRYVICIYVCYYVTLLLCYFVTILLYYSITLLLCYYVTMLLSFHLLLLCHICHTLLHSYSTTLLLSFNPLLCHMPYSITVFISFIRYIHTLPVGDVMIIPESWGHGVLNLQEVPIKPIISILICLLNPSYLY
jgi:hypothetical protein